MTTHSAPFRTLLPAFLDSIRERLKKRPDSEHEQAALRVVIGSVIFAYLYFAVSWDGEIQPAEWNFLFAGLLIIPISLAILLSTILSSNTSAVRRLIGMAIDLSFTTYSLYVLDDLGTPMVSVYLWATFGNGFRYGAKYLGVAAIASVCGFSLVL